MLNEEEQLASWQPPSIDYSSCTDRELSIAILESRGVLLLEGIPCGGAPFSSICGIFSKASQRPDLVSRVNAAYEKNFIFKDAFAFGTGAPHVDRKRTIDLSPSRLEGLERKDPGLRDELGSNFTTAVDFFERLRTGVVKRILAAASDAARVPSLKDDSVFNYRMVHYYGREVHPNEDEKRNENESPLRCGVHRDFGSVTLVFQDGVQGLQMFVGNEWRNVPSVKGNVALLQFGWCAMFRSNGRIPAVRHRVSEPTPPQVEFRDNAWKVKERTAAILFVAPSSDVPLDPVVLDGEKRLFRSTVADDLKTFDGRNWMYREGTIKGNDKMVKDRENKIWTTQDDAIKNRFFVGDDESCFQ